MMIREKVKLKQVLTCPECGSVVEKCDKCGYGFKEGEDVYCVAQEGEWHSLFAHYHEGCEDDKEE